MYKHKVIYLRRSTTCAQLDELSRDGWEFVEWMDSGWRDMVTVLDSQRCALIRSAQQQKGDSSGD